MFRAVIIDDEKWVVRSLMATIKDQPYFEVIGEAYDGIAGFELIKKEKPELAFVDVQMPGMGGLELLQTAQEGRLQTLFIMISGYAEFAYAQKAMFHNAIGYCLKPFSKSELLDSILKANEKVEQKFLSKTAEPENSKEEFKPNFIRVENKLVQSMLDYTNVHYSKDISIQDLADLCSINPNYASQLFSQEVGETFCTYLTNIRIEQSIYLLTHTDLSVSLISSQVGYRDYFYFAKVFKRITGITPTAYRNQPIPDRITIDRLGNRQKKMVKLENSLLNSL
jgi:two-component system response regulator YesN